MLCDAFSVHKRLLNHLQLDSDLLLKECQLFCDLAIEALNTVGDSFVSGSHGLVEQARKVVVVWACIGHTAHKRLTKVVSHARRLF